MKVFAFLMTMLSSLSFAAEGANQIKVIKSTGQKAIVEFPKGLQPKTGETYAIQSGAKESGGRANFISLASSVPLRLGGGSNLSAASSLQYGWNFGNFEVGPSIALAYVSAANRSANASGFSFGLGVDADYNFIENSTAQPFVAALAMRAVYVKGNIIVVGAGFAAKLFMLKQSQSAIRLQLLLGGELKGGAFEKSLELLGAGIQTYF